MGFDFVFFMSLACGCGLFITKANAKEYLGEAKRTPRFSFVIMPVQMVIPSSQDVGQGGLSLIGVAVMTTAPQKEITETAKTVKTVTVTLRPIL